MRLIPDAVLAALTIWGEARGESQDGKIAVAEVIRNRAKHKVQSDGTIAGTVLRPYQFSMWNTVDPNRREAAALDDQDPAYVDCRLAWDAAERGSDLVQGACFYFNPETLATPPGWADPSRFVVAIDRHRFYR